VSDGNAIILRIKDVAMREIVSGFATGTIDTENIVSSKGFDITLFGAPKG
jgi:hypothetical protein